MSVDVSQEIIRAASRGNRKSQQVIFRACKGKVHQLVRLFLGPRGRDEIEDVVAMCYVELFKSLRMFQGRCSFGTWIDRICYRACLMHLRRKYRRRKVTFMPAGDEISQSAEDQRPDALQRLVTQEQVEWLYEALDTISPERRAVIIMHEVQEKPIEEVAEIVRVRQGTVKSRLFRAKRELARRLNTLRRSE